MASHEELTEAMVRDYDQTRNLAEVAREYGLSRERVRQILKAAGVDTSRSKGAPKRKKGTWGGKREGAGRRPMIDHEPVRIRPVTLRGSDIEFLRKKGKGNVSAGIRALVDEAQQTVR